MLLPLLVAVLLFQVQVSADGYSCAAYIPVEVETLGDMAPSGMEYKLVIKPENEQNPMPEIKELVIKDKGSAQFGPMTYVTPGMYTYQVYQVAGSAKAITYDSAVYTVTVSVVNDENGGLRPEIFVIKDNAAGKTDKIIFSNSYENETVPEQTTEAVETTEAAETITVSEETHTSVITNPTENVTTTPGNAPKTGERIISAIVIGVIGLSMLMLSIILYKKKNEE